MSKVIKGIYTDVATYPDCTTYVLADVTLELSPEPTTVQATMEPWTTPEGIDGYKLTVWNSPQKPQGVPPPLD